MRFLNPIWLWGALAVAGVAVPLAIHLFSRFRSRPMDWAAMELLRRAMASRARRLKLEDLLLLILRCLAMGLLALALARPALTPSANLRWIGGKGDTARAAAVVAVDGSFSMAHKPGVRSRFDLAMDRARAVMETLSPGDPVTLVLMGSRPRIVLRNVAYEAERVNAALKTLKPLAEPLDLATCLGDLRELMSEMKAPSRECHLITDAQAVTWKEVPDAARSALRELQALGTVFLLPAGAPGAENVAVTGLSASGLLRRGAVVRYLADVRNPGTQPARDVTVRLLVNGMPVDKQTFDSLAPGQTAAASLFALFEREGLYAVEAALGDDSLPIDNTRYLLADVRGGVKVLCVDGDPSDEPFRGEADFLAAALQPEVRAQGAPAAGGVDVTTVPYDSLRISALASYDVVILANVPELNREQAYALGAFVRGGGGLIVFLGDNTSPSVANLRMRCADGSELLPARVLDFSGEGPVREEEDAKPGWTMHKAIGDDPVTRVFATMPPEQWSSIRFQRYVRTAPLQGARSLLRLEPGDDPLLLARQLGRGQVLLFTSSANRAWNDLVVHPAYLMLVQQAVMTLTRKDYERPVAVAQPLVFELPSDGTPASVLVLDPARRETRVRVAERDGRKAAVVTAAELPGIYEVKWDRDAPAPRLAANVDAAESALAVLRGDELAEAASRLSLRLIEENDNVAAAVRATRIGREIWPLLTILTLCALLAEALLARWFIWRNTQSREAQAAAVWQPGRTHRQAAADGALGGTGAGT